MLEKISSSKGLSSTRTGNPEAGGWRHLHWRYFKGWMWHLRTWFIGGIVCAGLTVRPDDLKYFFSINGYVILFGQNS